jgi:hypothetical protein
MFMGRRLFGVNYMTELKCKTCENYSSKIGNCSVDNSEPIGHGMAVDQINEIWGVTFSDCQKYKPSKLK